MLRAVGRVDHVTRNPGFRFTNVIRVPWLLHAFAFILIVGNGGHRAFALLCGKQNELTSRFVLDGNGAFTMC